MSFHIRKKYHFHAAHRNEYLVGDKCANIHGHTYRVEVEFRFDKTADSGVTMLFSDIDKHVEPLIKMLDHCFIIHTEDPLCDLLREHTRLYELPFPTSAENMATHIFDYLQNNGLPVIAVNLQETTSSIVSKQLHQ